MSSQLGKPNGWQKQVQRMNRVVELVHKLGKADSFTIRSTLGMSLGTYNNLCPDLRRMFADRVFFDDETKEWATDLEYKKLQIQKQKEEEALLKGTYSEEKIAVDETA